MCDWYDYVYNVCNYIVYIRLLICYYYYTDFTNVVLDTHLRDLALGDVKEMVDKV